ncbi:hypothetical protein FA09DRAFT_328445 [Tilletiopsis washingtonensis]|uniref:Uncharacterized protein n=1 Tax=Tilletiopsis washingtonensis TaxID=58919 RepID=A0A316ZDN8_9BASI|nr:hypothetical protein FA09DRAFT_328445 [Tilletiopsis washingtonensis]PWN99641.1 hypothetical protein FA09DRAFT_328445 [Tilletiopsis washingtonensis]
MPPRRSAPARVPAGDSFDYRTATAPPDALSGGAETTMLVDTFMKSHLKRLRKDADAASVELEALFTEAGEKATEMTGASEERVQISLSRIDFAMASSPAPSLSELDSDLAALRVQLHDNICRSFLDVVVHLEEHVNDEELPYVANDYELLPAKLRHWRRELVRNHKSATAERLRTQKAYVDGTQLVTLYKAILSLSA